MNKSLRWRNWSPVAVLVAQPTRLLIGVYVGIAVCGAALLALPLATPAGQGGASVDVALFTATSALTVTGLVVVDTATEWSRVGQAVILVLIQVGGFGITTFASVFAVLVFRRLGLRARLATQLEQNQPEIGGLRSLVGRIALFYLVVEVVGLLVLAIAFRQARGGSLPTALWDGLFHAVSAFNNAGFSNFAGGLDGFVAAPVVLVTVMVLVVVGGLGFPVVLEVIRSRLRSPSRWSIHTRLTLGMTGLLLVGGFVGFAVLEWTNPQTLGGIGGTGNRIVNAGFAAVMNRTAGFATVDMGEVGSAGLLLNSAQMFIGGGSASAAGGIKVTTFAVLAYAIVAELRGDRDVNVLGRRIAESTQRQALAVALLGVASIAAGSIVIAATSPSLPFGAVVFEVVSAVSTVGLSTGVTPELGTVGRLVTVALMLLGRLGPITFGTALVLRKRQLHLRYPEGRPLIG